MLKDIANILVVAGYGRRFLEEEFLHKFHDKLEALIQSALGIKKAIHMQTTLEDIQLMVVRPGENFESRTMKDAFSNGRWVNEPDGDEHGIVAGTTAMGVKCVRVGANGLTVEILLKPKVALLSTLLDAQI